MVAIAGGGSIASIEPCAKPALPSSAGVMFIAVSSAMSNFYSIDSLFRRSAATLLLVSLPVVVHATPHVHHRRGLGQSQGSQNTQQKPKANTYSDLERQPAQAPPYLDEPLKQMEKHIPELRGLLPSSDDEAALATILRKTGEQVDEFFDNAIDLVANEQIKQERDGFSRASVTVRDNYLIVRRGKGPDSDFDEFRMDENGNRLDRIGLNRGFLVTSGFALICSHFSPAAQWDSRFRYLGEQKIAGRDTYVVAFSQLPGEASQTITMTGPRGTAEHILTQGIAWVDKENYHILRMRTDLLAPHPDIGLDEQTTKVDFSEVRVSDLASPLWLPTNVNVYVKLGKNLDRPFEEAFRNQHHYTNYRHYHVSTKMVTPQ